MFRTNDPSWSQETGREGLHAHDTGVDGHGVEQARAGARMALTRNQIGLLCAAKAQKGGR
jgi:hypothetical protein